MKRDALLAEWPGDGPKSQATVGAKDVMVIDGPQGESAYFYLHAAVAYVVQTGNDADAVDALAFLP